MNEIQDGRQVEHYLQLHGLRSVFHEALRPHMSLNHYNQGELICSQGDPSHTLYVLAKGKIKIYTDSAEGRTLILSFKTPVDTIGDIEYVQDAAILNTVEAVSSVEMISIPYKWLRSHAGEHAPFLQFLLTNISRKFYAKSLSMSFNLMQPVEVRLASYLLSVAFADAEPESGGSIRTSGLRDAAHLIGTSYRHVNRVLGQFGADGLIERTKGLILVKDRAGLSVRANHNIYEARDE